MTVRSLISFLVLLLSSLISFAQQTDPIKQYRKLFFLAIERGDVDEMRVILRLGYVAPDDPPDIGHSSWIANACYYSPKGDLEPLKLMVERNSDPFVRNGAALSSCALSESSKFFYLIDIMHAKASAQHLPTKRYLNIRNLGTVLLAARAGAQNDQDLVERDAIAVEECKRMVEYGMSREEILKKEIPDTMSNSVTWNAIEFAKLEKLPQSEAYLESIIGSNK